MTMDDDEALLDDATIAELREAMSQTAFADLVTTFRDQIDQLTTRFSAATAAGDTAAAERAAHELAGTAGTLGAARLAARARQAMEACRSGATEPLEALAAAMARDGRATETAFGRYLSAG